jgi:two-component system response regulator AtoC
MRASVLVVDDERVFRVLAEEALVAEGFEVRTAANLARARVELDRSAPDVLILDRRLPDGDGIDFLRELTAQEAAPLVLVVTAYGDVENAVEALQAGAVDYLAKPVQVTDLVIKLRKVLEARGLRDRLALAKSSDAKPPVVAPKSRAAREVLETLTRVATSPFTPVFLNGPSGAGKQHAAEMLHRLTFPGLRDEAPFVEVNCAALPSHLVESELFGHEKGAFTDAKNTRRGLIEMADGGTLFLDEISELPDASQAKLLKFLDSMRFRRLGGQREIEVNLRVVAATNADLAKIVGTKFREDLYHRLTVFLVNIPPLAQRREDIADLAQSFVAHFAARVKKRTQGLSKGAVAKLCAYDFPGNVRELRNIIERGIILAQGAELTEADVMLPGRTETRDTTGAFFAVQTNEGVPPPLEAVERAYVGRVLEHLGGKRMIAAQTLGISYPTFLKRLRELGLDE